jgi:ParB family transcriptional regulator, chromosome partitioning protein
MSDDSTARMSAAPQAQGAAKRKPQALGRGLGALLGETRREEPLVSNGAQQGPSPRPSSGLAMLAISSIAPHPNQPRRYFDDAALDELAASIAQRGVIQPVIVRPMGARCAARATP